MNNKIEYQISLEIKENLATVTRPLNELAKSVESITDACQVLNNMATSCISVMTANADLVRKETDNLLQLSTVNQIASSGMQEFRDRLEQLKATSVESTGSLATYFSVINEYAPLITLLSGALKGLINNYNIVGVAQSAFTGGTVLVTRALYIYQMQILAARAAITATTGATKAMNIAIAASPYLIAAAAAAVLGVAIYKIATANNDAEKAHERLQETMTSMNKEVATEQAKLDALFTPLNLVKEGTEEWNRAKEKIVSKYGDYLSKIGVEIKDVNTARETYNKLSESILDTARSRAMESATSNAAEAYSEKEVEGLKQIREALYKEAESGKSISFGEAGKAFGQIRAAVRSGKDIPNEAKAILSKFKKTWTTDFAGNAHASSVADYINNQIGSIRLARVAFKNEMAEANALLGGSVGLNSSLTKDIPDNDGGNKKPGKVDSFAEGSISDLENRLSAEKKKQANAPIEKGMQIQLKIDDLEEQLAKAKMLVKFGEPVMLPLTLQTDGKAMEALTDFQKRIKEGEEDNSITPELEIPKKLSQVTEGYNCYAASVQSTAENLHLTQKGLSGASSLMSGLSGVVGEGAAGWLNYGANILSAVGQAIPALAQVIGGNIAQAFSGAAAQSQTVPFPFNIIALATSLAAVGSAVAQIPAFAAGGIAYGPTLGLFGEYAGAQNNPEVVAPLNRLRAMLQPTGDFGGEVNFRIRDRYLEGILQKRNNRIRRTH